MSVPAQSAAAIPEQAPVPVTTIIEPTSGWVPARLSELWAYRELLYFLTWRDVKVRYKQTALGVAWAVLQPAATMVVFTILFGRLARVPTDDVPYPLFSYAGLLLWTFFANAVTTSGMSVVANTNLITKVYFPRLIIPASAVAAALVDFAIAFVLLIPLALYYRAALGPALLLTPVFVVLAALAALGVGMWVAALNVKYRDARHALPFVVQLWMFATPVIYPASLVPLSWRWLLWLNPLTGIVEGFRNAIAGKPIPWLAIAASTSLIVVVLVSGLFTFRRMERDFADVV